MSQLLIQEYLNELADLRRIAGTTRETVVREAFKGLLKRWARAHDLTLVTEYEFTTPARDRRYIDGALLHELRVPFGYWEAKDEKDDLDEEIAAKFRRGYPQDNIIFEDSRRAVLIQNRQEVLRCAVDDPEALERLLKLFFSYERAEIREFRKAVAQFKVDLPNVLAALRDMIGTAYAEKKAFRDAAERFLRHAQETINPSVTAEDVREMLIQHILTEEIFSHVFDNTDFHRRNNVARELYALEETFFTGGLKYRTLEALRPYYAAIRSAAALVSSHHEKQTFLKVIYENFYKIYNRKAADRLGVVYTPNEIVRFIIEGADWLCEKHFAKRLIDREVEILDPAVGTGTFIAELIEHFRGQPAKLRYKYLEELHANEVAILPYYVANLNIEATYASVTGNYEEFPNLCFVDTLDNVAALRQLRGHQHELFGAVSEENVARIKRQNKRKISVVLGNPPYNANQLNENENNKNREYPAIDARIRSTYIAASEAQKTKLYDMYVRFFRWASDRIADNGIVAFITNRSFIDRATFDGFRKTIAEEFNEVYVVDLGGDVRADPRLSGTKHNVFGIQTGVAISFMVKRAKARGCRIRYARRPQMETAEEKLAFLASTKLNAIGFTEVVPNARNDWINQTANDFDSFLPVADRETRAVQIAAQERAIFRLYSLGISTNRDEWLYDRDREQLASKVRYLIAEYDRVPRNAEEFPETIKWSRNLKRRLAQGRREPFSSQRIVRASYRPYSRRWLYQSDLFIDEPGAAEKIFPPGARNAAICFSDVGSRTDFCVLAIDGLADLHFGAAVDAYQQLPRFRFVDRQRVDNITDWALAQFADHYGRRSKRPITKDAIFHYVYGVLHDPAYREGYELNLKRAYPRIPFYADFWKWTDWGEELMRLHIGYEDVEPWPLRRIDTGTAAKGPKGVPPKPLLRANKDAGNIELDTDTQLTGIPEAAWRYKLGNRSALEWVLDQHKERAPKDPVIRARFNTYQFAAEKEKVIDLLRRVTTVSVRTEQILAQMREAGSAR